MVAIEPLAAAPPSQKTPTNVARNPSNDEIITCSFVHILSAFAIVEAQ